MGQAKEVFAIIGRKLRLLRAKTGADGIISSKQPVTDQRERKSEERSLTLSARSVDGQTVVTSSVGHVTKSKGGSF